MIQRPFRMVSVTAVLVLSSVGAGFAEPPRVAAPPVPPPLMESLPVPAPPPGVVGIAGGGPDVLYVASPMAEGAWMGLQLAPVPAALAAHLKLADKGVMIRNVFKDSPADRAGLARYDVIVGVDGKDVERGVEMFSEYVRGRQPGDTVSLNVLQGGESRTLSIKLAAMPPRLDERELKYEDDPDVAQRRIYGLRGKILRPGPEGWILDDLGDLPHMPDFQEWLKGRPGAAPPARAQAEPGQNEVTEARVNTEGQVLQVRREKDGSIEVRRYKVGTPADRVEPRRYGTFEDLRKADPEAAALLGPTSQPAGPAERTPDVRRGLKEREDALKRQRDAMKEYEDALRQYVKKYQQEFNQRVPAPAPDAGRWREWRERVFPDEGGGQGLRRPGPGRGDHQPEATFEVRADGSISVQVDDGATRLNLSFPDEKTFQAKAPRLFERYKGTLEKAR